MHSNGGVCRYSSETKNISLRSPETFAERIDSKAGFVDQNPVVLISICQLVYCFVTIDNIE